MRCRSSPSALIRPRSTLSSTPSTARAGAASSDRRCSRCCTTRGAAVRTRLPPAAARAALANAALVRAALGVRGQRQPPARGKRRPRRGSGLAAHGRPHPPRPLRALSSREGSSQWQRSWAACGRARLRPSPRPRRPPARGAASRRPVRHAAPPLALGSSLPCSHLRASRRHSARRRRSGPLAGNSRHPPRNGLPSGNRRRTRGCWALGSSLRCSRLRASHRHSARRKRSGPLGRRLARSSRRHRSSRRRRRSAG